MGRRVPVLGLLKIAKSKLGEIRIEDIRRYGKHFSEASFRDKLRAVGKLLGENTLLPILKGYYVLTSPTTKAGEKALLIGALGYFILPFDFVPDFLAGLLGFGDDLMVITFVLAKVQNNITPEIEEKAERMMRKILGERTAEIDLLA